MFGLLFNPSFFTIAKFATTTDVADVRNGMNLGLLANLALAGGIALVYGKAGVVPAAATAATGVGLWLLYDNAINQKQATTTP